MPELLLIRGAKQLVTLRGPRGPRRGAALRELGLICDGALLARDGIIEEVGPARRVENLALARRAVEIDASGRVVMPGFVDSHTHLVHGSPWLEDFDARVRGEPPEQPQGLHGSIQKIHSLSARSLAGRAGKLAGMMLRHGTTCCEAKSGYGRDQTGEIKVLRALRALNGHPLEVVSTYLSGLGALEQSEAQCWDTLLRECNELLPQIRRRGLARFVDVFCDRPGFHLEQTRRFLQIAIGYGFSVKMHVDQFCHTGGAALAAGLGTISADHLEYADGQDIAALAGSPTIATLLPGSVFHLGLERYAPARALIDGGAAVALATGFNPETCPTCSMPMVVALACSRMHMSAAEAISAATINGAHALGSAERMGSLETGKQADLLILNGSDYREIPYRFGVNLVHAVVQRGALVYREGAIRS